MNYLAHFVFNHDVLGLSPEPYFAMGVVLPDLWLRYSRQHRIRWKAVRAARPSGGVDAQLRAGLLNHIDADRCFHTLPVFLRWQREIKQAVDAGDTHAALLDFLAHMSIELALDHHLVRRDPELVDRFYSVVGRAVSTDVAERVGRLGQVATAGLESVLDRFVARRFLARYDRQSGLTQVVEIVLELARIPAPPRPQIGAVLAEACTRAAPEAVWRGLRPAMAASSSPPLAAHVRPAPSPDE